MTKSFAPMLSGKAPDDLAQLHYPVLVSPKLDGIRCIIRDGQALSRNLKPIPNEYIQRSLSGIPNGLDGELIVGAPTGDDVWNRSQSGVMRKDGLPEFCFFVFDMVMPGVGFASRLAMARKALSNFSNTKIVDHTAAFTPEELSRFEAFYVEKGYEGVMIRDPDGAYKYGRSTTKEGGLLKLKRWFDDEATVLEFVEQFHNDNDATTDLLGRTKRSSSKEGKVGKNTLGALRCVTKDGVVFEIGTGMDDKTRQAVWDNRPDYLRAVVTFKYQSVSPAGIPRFPVFKGFRDKNDMDAAPVPFTRPPTIDPTGEALAIHTAERL